MSASVDVRIDSIAAGGDGVGRHEGMVVFVPRTAPGDLARVAARREDRLMRGRLMQVLEPSGTRVDPPCAHYTQDRCGGCQLQHMEYEAQLSAKSAIIRDALSRIGKLATAAPEVAASPRQWRYRRKLTLAFRRAGDRWIAGLRRYDAPDEVFALVDCPITDEAVLAVWQVVLAQQQLLPHARELRGAVRALDQGFAFTLEGGRRWPNHADFFEAVPQLSELWWVPDGGSRRLIHARTTSQAGASFVQVNPRVSDELRAWVMHLAGERKPRTAVDAYSGTGDIALQLSQLGARVVAIELDADAARVAGARLPSGSRAVAAPVERALASALPANLVVMNPPRAGLDASVPEILNGGDEKPAALLYISCNPATLARDVRRLSAYEVRSVRGFDMFPQTAHVETVCEMVPAA